MRRGAAVRCDAAARHLPPRRRRVAGAVLDGRSVDTTMGFTPLEGLVMATRSGRRPGAGALAARATRGLSRHELAEALEHESGLSASPAPPTCARCWRATTRGARGLALDVYVHRLRAGIAAMAAALGGLDALVFTGGVGGTRSASGRWRVPGSAISASGRPTNACVWSSSPAHEDLEKIARQVRTLLGAERVEDLSHATARRAGRPREDAHDDGEDEEDDELAGRQLEPEAEVARARRSPAQAKRMPIAGAEQRRR